MRETTLNDFLADFGQVEADTNANNKGVCFITLRVSPEAKARYDKLQENSRKKFSKKAREVLLALISAAEARTV